jgi:tetratricopeptide (TPR) repeat protein
MLFEHDQYDEARQYVDRAERLLQNTLAPLTSPAARGVRILRARQLVHDGKQDDAAKVLESWLPRPLPQNQLPLLLDVAGQMEGLELYADAERLLKEYQGQSPIAGKMALAGFLGRRGDIDQSFAMLDEARAEVPLIEVVSAGLVNLRNYPEKVTDAQRKQLEDWGKAAVSESTDPQRMKFAQAELYDLLGRYDEVERIYREMLSDPNLPAGTRAVLQNNLSFVLAGANPTPARGAEALKLIQDAIKVLGPSSDLIDTRALAYMAQGKYDQAAADIRLAVRDRPTTSKYYHLAQVEKQLGNLGAAKEAIVKAEELHPEHNPFTPFERKGYEQLKSEMN